MWTEEQVLNRLGALNLKFHNAYKGSITYMWGGLMKNKKNVQVIASVIHESSSDYYRADIKREELLKNHEWDFLEIKVNAQVVYLHKSETYKYLKG